MRNVDHLDILSDTGRARIPEDTTMDKPIDPSPITNLDPVVVTAFRDRLGGHLLLPEDAGYDESRRIWNGMIDKHPALIVRAAGVADVRQAVIFAREHNLPLSIKGGGHNVAGHAVSDGGLMLDLGTMRAVRVDPTARTARVQGGALWRDVDRETTAFGLATTGGVVSSTGVAGLTLGGGIGWLIGKHGMTIDNLLSVDLVTADGEFVTAGVESHPDLFWAVRGGGGNFGVATSFEFALHPQGDVLGAILVYPVARAADLLAFYREFTATAPEELNADGIVGTDPESGARVAIIAVCWVGDPAEGQRAIESLRRLGEPLFEMVGPVPYAAWQQAFDTENPSGRRYYWKGNLLRDLPDAVLEAVVDLASAPPLPGLMIAFESYRGAMNRVSASATAFPHRDAHYQLVISGGWDDPADDQVGIGWVRGLHAATEAYALNGGFLNFNAMDETDRSRRVRAGFGQNWDRLVEIKRRYDPHNLFRENNNIVP
jgi:hypothetical protein